MGGKKSRMGGAGCGGSRSRRNERGRGEPTRGDRGKLDSSRHLIPHRATRSPVRLEDLAGILSGTTTFERLLAILKESRNDED